MFDTWDTGPFGNYGVPVTGPDSGSSSGLDFTSIINRGLDILGARYGEGQYVSPDDPRYGQPGYYGSPGYRGPTSPTVPGAQVGGTGGFSLSPMTWLIIGVGVIFLLKKK